MFLLSLKKLKDNDRYKDIRVANDMSEEDRAANKRLLKEAYQKNQDEKPTDYKYKVRGPPHDLKIVKVYAKNWLRLQHWKQKDILLTQTKIKNQNDF